MMKLTGRCPDHASYFSLVVAENTHCSQLGGIVLARSLSKNCKIQLLTYQVIIVHELTLGLSNWLTASSLW